MIVFTCDPGSPFYNDVVRSPLGSSWLAYLNFEDGSTTSYGDSISSHDLPIGAICSKVIWASTLQPVEFKMTEPPARDIFTAAAHFQQRMQRKKSAYLMSLCVIPVLRNKGIAKLLLSKQMKHYEDSTDIHDIFLHVQTNNDSALQLVGEPSAIFKLSAQTAYLEQLSVRLSWI